MKITYLAKTIQAELSDDEAETYEYIGEINFKLYLEQLFKSRRLQQEEEMKIEITKGMDRNQLKAELVRKRNV